MVWVGRVRGGGPPRCRTAAPSSRRHRAPRQQDRGRPGGQHGPPGRTGCGGFLDDGGQVRDGDVEGGGRAGGDQGGQSGRRPGARVLVGPLGEGPRHVPGRGPGRRVLGEARLDERQQGGREAVQVRWLVHGAEQYGRGPAVPERAAAGRRVREDAAQREDVAGGPGPLPGRLLGGEVAGRADQRIGLGEGGGALVAGDAEVDEPGPVEREEHVRRFHVAVDQAGSVHRDERVGEPGPERADGPGRQGALGDDDLGQRGARLEHGGEREGRFPDDLLFRQNPSGRGSLDSRACRCSSWYSPSPKRWESRRVPSGR